jgi:glycosyltransferase involved in cell wall biosynthesis
MRILIATDAWEPQVNGVVTTLKKLKELSNDIVYVTPDDFKSIPNFIYPEIRIAIPNQKRIELLINLYNPDYIHIATEGPIGWAFRKWCIKNNKKFTTSYHTKFPEFFKAFYNIPTWMTYWIFRKFHNSGNGMFVATKSLETHLKSKGFKNLVAWNRGVDLSQFKPAGRTGKTKTNILLYVGRVSKEKNIEAFLELDFPNYKKIVVGDGPELNKLKQKYPKVMFTGTLQGEKLAHTYSMADCFIFPSKADTFGLVIIEALACGVPVAAYPVTGPIDILNEKVGCVNDSLSVAVENALLLDRKDCVEHAKKYDWQIVADMFIENIIKSNTRNKEDEIY